MAIAICRQMDRGVTEAGRHQLEREFEAAVLLSVDAPGGMEVAQVVEPRILCLAGCGDDTGGDPDRSQPALDDVGVIQNAAVLVGEDQIELTLGAGELPFAQCLDQLGRQRKRSPPRRRLDRPDLVVTVGALMDVEFAVFEVDIVPE